MPVHRAVLTGIGAISPLGIGWQEIYKRATSGYADFPLWNPDLNPPHPRARLGLLEDIPTDKYCSHRDRQSMDRAMSLAVVTTGLALSDAALVDEALLALKDEIATIVASMHAEIPAFSRYFGQLLGNPNGIVNPSHFVMMAPNIAAGKMALQFGLRGWSSMISCGEASGTHALARAVDWISRGRVPIVVVGAHEVLSRGSLQHLVATQNCFELRERGQPASNNASAPAEGACYFVVESEENASRRGVSPYAVLGPITHGYLIKCPLESAYRLVDRHVRKLASSAGSLPTLFVSGIGGASPSVAEIEGQLLARFRDLGTEGTEFRPRALFGDGGAQSILFQVACAAQIINDQAAPASLQPPSTCQTLDVSTTGLLGIHTRSAVATQVTNRRACGIVGVTAYDKFPPGAPRISQ